MIFMEFTQEEFNFLYDLVLDSYDVKGRLYTKFGIGGDLLAGDSIRSRATGQISIPCIVTDAFITEIDEADARAIAKGW